MPIGPGCGIGPGGGMLPMPGLAPAMIAWIGASDMIVAATGTEDGTPPASALPQLRQNFIPGGFSPRHTPHTVGNPAGAAGVCPKA